MLELASKQSKEFDSTTISHKLTEYCDSLYPILVEIYNENKSELAQINVENMTRKISKGTMYLIINSNEEGRKQFKIDEVLSLYLIDISEVVMVNFYKMVACLIQMFRNCMNSNGF
jgi:hypothetical protein